jgi:hypothetical protein
MSIATWSLIQPIRKNEVEFPTMNSVKILIMAMDHVLLSFCKLHEFKNWLHAVPPT